MQRYGKLFGFWSSDAQIYLRMRHRRVQFTAWVILNRTILNRCRNHWTAACLRESYMETTSNPARVEARLPNRKLSRWETFAMLYRRMFPSWNYYHWREYHQPAYNIRPDIKATDDAAFLILSDFHIRWLLFHPCPTLFQFLRFLIAISFYW